MQATRLLSYLKAFCQNPALVFIVLAGIFGALSIYTQPPMAANDEVAHFARAYEVSHGRLISSILPNKALGYTVPDAIPAMDRLNTWNNYGKPDPERLHTGIDTFRHISIRQTARSDFSFSNTAQYSAFAYLPQALAITFSRLCNFSILTTLYLTRWVVLACFLVLVGTAIWITPTKKWLFTAVGLLPICIQAAASASIDALVIGSMALFAACFLRVYSTKKLRLQVYRWSIPATPVFALLAAYVGLAKAPYYLVFPILAFLPSTVFKSRAHKIRFLVYTLALPFLLLYAWNVALSLHGSAEAQRVSISAAHIYPPSTITGIRYLLHPAYTIKLFYYTYIDQLTLHQETPNFIFMGIFGIFLSYHLTAPIWYAFTVAFTLFVGYFMTDKQSIAFGRYFRVLLFAMIALCCLLISLSMYFYTSSTGQSFINGIQGRYFIPLLIFGLFFIRPKSFIVVSDQLRVKVTVISFFIVNLGLMQLMYLEWFWR